MSMHSWQLAGGFFVHDVVALQSLFQIFLRSPSNRNFCQYNASSQNHLHLKITLAVKAHS